MGEAQKVPYGQLLDEARVAFDGGTDLTIAVEEEFALLDPETLTMVNRFEEVKAAAAGNPFDDHLVGELIASEAISSPTRCGSSSVPAAAAWSSSKRFVSSSVSGSRSASSSSTATVKSVADSNPSRANAICSAGLRRCSSPIVELH